MKHFLSWAYSKRPLLVAMVLLSLLLNTANIIIVGHLHLLSVAWAGSVFLLGIASSVAWAGSVFCMLRCYHWDNVAEKNIALLAKYRGVVHNVP
jgi:hypothetical protein